MNQNRINLAVLLGDPSGIGPELISKLLTEKITEKANIVIIGEKNILESGNKISGNSHDLKFVENFDEINFQDGNKFFLDISKGQKS
jgi:4-hydroxythreonine-4-phosphate dehydrogenase